MTKKKSELRDQFVAVTTDSKTPNTLTADTLRKSDKGEDVFYASSAADLFKQLGI